MVDVQSCILARNTVMASVASVAFCSRGSHIELLLDYGCANSGKADDHSNQTQMFRFLQQLQCFLAADSRIHGSGRNLKIVADLFPAHNDGYDQGAQDHEAGTEDKQIGGADLLGISPCQIGSENASERRAASDESKQALGLAGIENHVGKGPKLADQQDAQDEAEQIEGNRYPSLLATE